MRKILMELSQMDRDTTTEAVVPVTMSLEFYNKITYLSKEYPKEIGGWITGKFSDEGIFLEDLLIPKQEVTYGSVDISAGAGVELLKEFKDKCKKIVGHFHSHHTMGCSWSGIDETLMKEHMGPRKRYIFIVSSEGDHRIRLELKEPFRLSIDNLDYEVIDENYDKIKEKLLKEIEKKVVLPSHTDSGKDNFSNYRRGLMDNAQLTSRDKTIYGVGFKKGKPEEQTPLGELNAANGEDFALEIADNIIAEYCGRSLKICGLESHMASTLMSAFKEYKPSIEDKDYYNKEVSFNLKRGKARKLIPLIQDVIDDYNSKFIDDIKKEDYIG